MLSANLSGPFRGCLYYALLGLPQATGLAGGYDFVKQFSTPLWKTYAFFAWGTENRLTE